MTSSKGDQPKWWEKAFGPGPDPAAKHALTPVRCVKCNREYLRQTSGGCPQCGSVYSVSQRADGEKKLSGCMIAFLILLGLLMLLLAAIAGGTNMYFSGL